MSKTRTIKTVKRVSQSSFDWEVRRRYFYYLLGYHGFNESFRAEAEDYVSSRVSEAGLRKVVEAHIRALKLKKNPDKTGGLEGFDGTRKVRQVVVDETNPALNRPRERVSKNIKHDYIEKLFGEKKIGEAQKRAGDRVRQLVESMGVGLGSVKAIDLAKIRVDTSGGGVDVRDSVLDAAQELTGLGRAMDADKHALVIRVCGFDERIKALAPSFEEDESKLVNGNCSQRTHDHCGRLFRSGLMQAAIYFGYASSREMQRYQSPMRVWGSDESSRGKGLST